MVLERTLERRKEFFRFLEEGYKINEACKLAGLSFPQIMSFEDE